MNLELSQGLGMYQEQTQSLSIEQRLLLDQKLVQLMDSLEDSFPPNGKKEEILKKLLEQAVNNISNESLRKSLAILIADDSFTEQVLNNLDVLAFGEKQTMTDFILEYVYNMHFGKFEISSGDSGNTEIITDVDFHFFSVAYNNPEIAEKNMKDDERSLAVTDDKSGLIREISMYIHAKKVVELMRTEIATIIDLVKLILNVKINDKNETVSNFIKESALLGKFKLFESERLVKRFINKCEGVAVSRLSEEYKESFLNSIGEFVLISFGVISPSVFTLKQGNIDSEMGEQMRSIMEESGLDFDKIMKDYNLTKRGGFFYQRWATLNERPSAVSDDNVREFLTKTVRKDSDVLLEASGFEEIIEKIKGIKKDTKDRDEREEQFAQIFDELFSDTNFMNTLLECAKGWFNELATFYPKKKAE
ncbi:MAG: hypothetical protein NTU76_00895 [Candidatus Taylorbacteria bacterium]|nr:hypothetical protein [Candidatus Taylorbacteria bacterium]